MLLCFNSQIQKQNRLPAYRIFTRTASSFFRKLLKPHTTLHSSAFAGTEYDNNVAVYEKTTCLIISVTKPHKSAGTEPAITRFFNEKQLDLLAEQPYARIILHILTQLNAPSYQEST